MPPGPDRYQSVTAQACVARSTTQRSTFNGHSCVRTLAQHSPTSLRISRSTLQTLTFLLSLTTNLPSQAPLQTPCYRPSRARHTSEIIDAALSEYEKKTRNQLLGHLIATELQRCASVDAILAILQGQVAAFQRLRMAIRDVLYMFSGTPGGVAGLGFPEQGQSLLDSEDSPLYKMTCGKYWSREDGVRVAWLLLERGMDVNRIRNDQCTPRTGPLAVSWGEYESQEDGVDIAQLLPERDSDVSAREARTNGLRHMPHPTTGGPRSYGYFSIVVQERTWRLTMETPLAPSFASWRLRCMTDTGARRRRERTTAQRPLHGTAYSSAFYWRKIDVVQLLLEAQTWRPARELHPCTRFRRANTDPKKMVFVLDGYYWSMSRT
ncbi:hypothetical protein EDB85DRAFT_1893802 [Lactarius pseudohatsudake]|nr:hypothetical protein EDB85DRAFT_1893802 [Lactarius pseudohatsudake]